MAKLERPSHTTQRHYQSGDTHVRRVRTEAAWVYRLHARVGPELEKRSQGLPKAVRDIAWKAQLRVCNRFRRLHAPGKEKQKIVTAVARELCGFVWAIANELELARR